MLAHLKNRLGKGIDADLLYAITPSASNIPLKHLMLCALAYSIRQLQVLFEFDQ